MPASVITRLPANRRTECLRRISANARRLRQGYGVGGAINANLVGRNDSCEALLTHMGIIPITSFPTAVSLNAAIQAFPARRPAATETVSVIGGTAPVVFAPGDPSKLDVFAAGGAQPVTATSSVDAAATGAALVSVTP